MKRLEDSVPINYWYIYIYIYDYTIEKYNRENIQLANRNFNSTSNFNGKKIVMGWEKNMDQ